MFKSTNPATGEIWKEHLEHGEDEIEARIVRASDAYRHWRETGHEERAALLAAIADRYEDQADRLAETVTREMGKTLKTAQAEVMKCVAAFRHYAERGPGMLAPRRIELGNGGTAETRWLPQGVILAIMPWNFPHWQAVRFLAPTIMAGNVGLLKHASICQGVAEDVERIVREAGAPEGLFQNLAIKSDKVNAIIDDPRIAGVTLTGSDGAGKAVAERAGRNLKKVVLELGGSDPFVVMPSADLDAAVEQAVTARVQNSGQSCICGKRLILHADIHDAFLSRFETAMKAVKVGDPTDEATDVGPLSSVKQRDTVLEQIEAAKAEGATLAFGGEKVEGDGAYLTPGMLTGLPRNSKLTREEIFGPVMMVFRVESLDEAIEVANDIPFGLGSSVWTSVEAEQERFVRDIEAGMTAINQMLASSPEAPFGGIKNSGHGRELGAFGLHEFMNLKTVMLPR